MPARSMLSTMRAIAVVVLLSATVTARAVPIPVVDGPIPGVTPGDPSRDYPWGATDVDLAKAKWVEEELFFAGTARRFDFPSGVFAEEHPYRSRMLVRRPRSPRRFNGTVVVEWLNVTDQRDGDYDWLMLSDHLLREGYAWVGVSVQRVGVHAATTGLRDWSPARYGTLDLTDGGLVLDDGLMLDVFSQAGAALRAPGDVDPLGPLRRRGVRRLIATGHSQSAIFLTTYVNGAHTGAAVYDGFILHSTGNVVAADVDTKVFHLRAESDVQFLPHQADADHVRTWEVAGTSHFDWPQEHARAGILRRDGVTPATPTPCDLPFWTRVPFHHVFAATLDHLVRWIAEGTPPPRTEPIAVDRSGIVRDGNGRVSGGIRLADYEVPTANNSGQNRGPTFDCTKSLIGSWVPYDEARLATLYPTHAQYVRRVRRIVRDNLRAGVIVRADAKATVAAARRSPVGR